MSIDDVWSGKVRAGYVLALVEQLHLNPHSRVRMINLGGDIRFIGWDANTELAADRYDQFVQFTAGFSKQSIDPSQLYPRPGRDSDPESDPSLFAPSIDEFDPAAFMRVIAGR